MFSQLPGPGNDYQKEYQKLRTKRVSEILKSQHMTEDDFVFLDNFIKTYFPDASKALKNTLTKDALKKIYLGTQYKELEAGETVFTHQESKNLFILVISGKIDVVEENKDADSNSALKSASKGEVLNPTELQALAQPSKTIRGVTAEKSEILVYEKELYDSIIKEFAFAAANSKVKAVSKNFLKIKKMDRGSKEEFLTYFKVEKFSKGTVIINIKSKVEEIYTVQTGKIILCAPNDCAPEYKQTKLVIGVLGPESIFNEQPLVLEKPSPYFAICLEDVEVLSVNKSNLNFVTDIETMNDLRANCQGKQRLQSALFEKYQKMSKEEVEKSQNKILEKLGIKTKEINDVFEKFDPKSKTSHQFAKNLEKFNKDMGKSAAMSSNKLPVGPARGFSEFATPRIVSKDPNFRNLDPQRQLALLTLRNVGTNLRAGNAVPQKNLKDMTKDDIMKMQNRLLDEEKAECDKIVQKKTISDKLNINKPVEEEKQSDNNTGVDSKKGLFNKMKMDSRSLLANFHLGTGEKEKEESKPVSVLNPEVKPSEPALPKAAGDPDEMALKQTQKSLANLLGSTSGPKIRPQTDIINKKRTSLLKNPNLL